MKEEGAVKEEEDAVIEEDAEESALVDAAADSRSTMSMLSLHYKFSDQRLAII